MTAGGLTPLAAASPAKARTRSTIERRTGVGDARKGLVKLKALAAAEKLDGIAFRRALSETGVGSTGHGQLLVKELHRDAEDLRQIEQPAGADPVDALLVLLDLLEGEAEMLAEFLLAHPEQHPPQTHPTSDVYIDGIGTPRATLFYFRAFQRIFS